MTSRVAILVSGSGTNMERLIDAFQGATDVDICLVLCNKDGAGAIEKAGRLGVRTEVIPHTGFGSRAEFDAHLVERLRLAEIDWICLAGFMRVLTPEFIDAFPNRILNIHPSLLPAFPGLHAMRQALEYGVSVSGCTVHLVTHEMDSGPIVAQAVVDVEPGETESSLAKKIQAEEHRIYPEALARVVRSSWHLDGRVFREA